MSSRISACTPTAGHMSCHTLSPVCSLLCNSPPYILWWQSVRPQPVNLHSTHLTCPLLVFSTLLHIPGQPVPLADTAYSTDPIPSLLHPSMLALTTTAWSICHWNTPTYMQLNPQAASLYPSQSLLCPPVATTLLLLELHPKTFPVPSTPTNCPPAL
jgi:hypothetical protein